MRVIEVEHSVIKSQVEEVPSGLDALNEQLLDQLVGQSRERGLLRALTNEVRIAPQLCNIPRVRLGSRIT